jgi:hypothetical protein
MKTTMYTKPEIVDIFKEQYPDIRDKAKTDKPFVRQAWNDFTDELSRAGQIPERGRDWVNPILKPEER